MSKAPHSMDPGIGTGRRRLMSAVLVLLPVLLFLAGCGGGGEEGLGEDRVVRLTSGPGLKEFPCFSPDGREIAYSVSSAEQEYDFKIRIVPLGEADPRLPLPDDSPQVCLQWAPDGQGLYTLSIWDSSVRLIALDGRERARYSSDGLAEPVAISPDGSRILYRRRRGETMDMGVRSVGKAAMDFLAETPEWEVDGCFGPDDDITVVRRQNLQADRSEIAVWSAETREYVPVALPGTRNIDPSWSADGRLLAYASDESGSFDIWVHDPSTGRSLQVTSGSQDDRFPNWSRDGGRLTFCRWAVVSHVFVSEASTGEVRRLTGGQSRDRFPVLSSQGDWVAFARGQSIAGLPRSPALCVASASGGPIHPLDLESIRLLPDQGGIAWSPDDTELAFVADDGSGNVDLYRVSRNGGAPARVTIRRGTDFDPEWSPDGTCLAYTRGVEGDEDTAIWVIPATGGMPERISSSPGVNGGAVWAPDSDRVAHFSYTRGAAAGADLLVSSRSDPFASRLLLHDGSINIPLAWNEDGSEVLFRKDERSGSSFWSIPVDGGQPVKIGEAPDENAGRGQLMELNDAGRPYAKRLYPGGMHTFAEGEDIGDIYVIEISSLLGYER